MSDMTYYQKNRKVILNRAKDYYENEDNNMEIGETKKLFNKL